MHRLSIASFRQCALASVVVVSLAACGEVHIPASSPGETPVLSPSASQTAAAAASNALVGVEWQLTTLSVGGRTQTVDSQDAILRFDGEGGFSGGACNRVFGDVVITGSTLVLRTTGSTLKSCDGTDGGVDRVMTSLHDVPIAWSVVDAELHLKTPDGIDLRYRALPVRSGPP